MRLGDFDALKEDFADMRDGHPIFSDSEMLSTKDIAKIIDSAPTFEPEIEYGTDGQPYRLFISVISGGQVVPDMLQGWRYEERPQGEWIIDGHHIRCNRCNEYICNTDREGNKIPDSFCPNCGADMRGEKK